MENIYTDDMKDLVLSRQDFASFRKKNRLYVDKTEYAYRLAKEKEGFYFISRPRRFGKSLFCSMLEALFEGRKDLFEGLYIAEKTDYDFEKLPVLSFNFANVSSATFEDFYSELKYSVIDSANKLGIQLSADGSPSLLLGILLEEIVRKTGKQAVIIIDEYDNNITENIEKKDRDTAEEMRNVLNDFFKRIKNSSKYICFCFITGVVKLSHLSIFSAMNNLVDLTMDEDFAGAFGYTDEEFDEYFSEGIDEYLEANPGKYESRAEFREMIKEYYDGYRFSPDSETTVYNPVSIGFFFENKCRFNNYWEATGLSTLVVKLAKDFNLMSILKDGDTFLNKSSFINFDISSIGSSNLSASSVIALAYYSGYLTIQGVAEFDNDTYILGFPNLEIRSTFTDNLIMRFIGNDDIRASWLMALRTACYGGDEDGVERCMRDYYAAFPYDAFPKGKEKNYQIAFNAVFVMLSVPNDFEKRTYRGRIDSVVAAGKHLWIFELKVDGSADDALKQIEEKDYAGRYAYLRKQGITIHKIGLSISSETREIAEWKCLSE